MKPFNLDTVLEHRKRLVNIARNKLYDARRERDKTQTKLTATEEKYNSILTDRDNLKNTDCTILSFVEIERSLEFTKERITELQVLFENKETFVKRAKENLLIKAKDKKVLEKLKEKQNNQWKKFIEKKEAASLDEIAILHHKK